MLTETAYQRPRIGREDFIRLGDFYPHDIQRGRRALHAPHLTDCFHPLGIDFVSAFTPHIALLGFEAT
jgi:hypothetical protein